MAEENSNVSSTTEASTSASTESQSVSTNVASGSSDTQANTQVDSSTSKNTSPLGGDGDIQKAENYIDGLDLPEETKAKLIERIQYGAKTRQSVADKTIAKIKSESQVNAQTLKQMIETNQNGIRDELMKMREEEEMIAQNSSDPSVNFEWIADNWEKIPNDQKNSIAQNLSPEQRLTLKNTLTLKQAQIAENKVMIEKIHNENVTKYGKNYESSAQNFIPYFEQNYYKNAPEFVYKAMNYEQYGKEMYEKGKQERQIGSPLGNSGTKTGTPNKNFKNPTDALMASLEEKGMTESDFLRLLK